MDWNSIYINTAQALFNPVTIAFALAALGLAVHFGFVGLLNFGIAGFMAVGGYGYRNLRAELWVPPGGRLCLPRLSRQLSSH